MSFERSSPRVSKKRLRDRCRGVTAGRAFVWTWQTCHLKFISNSFRRLRQIFGLLCEKDVPGCGS